MISEILENISQSASSGLEHFLKNHCFQKAEIMSVPVSKTSLILLKNNDNFKNTTGSNKIADIKYKLDVKLQKIDLKYRLHLKNEQNIKIILIMNLYE